MCYSLVVASFEAFDLMLRSLYMGRTAPIARAKNVMAHFEEEEY